MLRCYMHADREEASAVTVQVLQDKMERCIPDSATVHSISERCEGGNVTGSAGWSNEWMVQTEWHQMQVVVYGIWYQGMQECM